MNVNAKKVTALALSAVLVLGAAGTAAVSAKDAAPEKKEDERPVLTAPARLDAAPSKDETVYVFTDASGASEKVLVSSWLKNPGRADVLRDEAALSGIENVKGSETWTEGAGHQLNWNAAGEDIYYQGVSDQKAPVSVRIAYTLDGKPVSPEALAGKSGHVTIRFTYENHQTETITVGGRQVEIHVPFVMLTGLMLSADHFRNVEVTNAKMENLGNEIAVLGVALPGMQENLNRDELEFPACVEIEADTDCFEMGPTMTVATPSLLQKLDPAHFDLSDLQEQAATLTDGVTQLLDGSGQLYDGLNTLLEQSDALVSGVDQLASGAAQLTEGASALRTGAGQLQSGAARLQSGLGQLDSNSAALNAGARQVFNTLLATANQQIAAAGLEVPPLTIENYAETLNTVIASLDETAVYESALRQVTEAVNARRGEIEAAVRQVVEDQVRVQAEPLVTEAVRAAVEEQIRAQEDTIRAIVLEKALHMTPEEYEAAIKLGLISEEQQAQVDAAVENAIQEQMEQQMESDAVQAKIAAITDQKVAEQIETPEIQALIDENVELQVQKAIAETMASEEIQAKLRAAAEGAQSLISLKASLDSYNSFYLGLLTYTDGVGTAARGSGELIAGADALKSGMDSLNEGVSALSGGIFAMKEKTPALLDGITALRDGSALLRDGLQQLMDEGVSKIAELTGEDLTELTDRLTATVEAAKAYQTFSGAADGTESHVKFILKTAEISAE